MGLDGSYEWSTTRDKLFIKDSNNSTGSFDGHLNVQIPGSTEVRFFDIERGHYHFVGGERSKTIISIVASTRRSATEAIFLVFTGHTSFKSGYQPTKIFVRGNYAEVTSGDPPVVGELNISSFSAVFKSS